VRWAGIGTILVRSTMSGQPDAPAAFIPGKQSPVPACNVRARGEVSVGLMQP
jgi:hypothetical protein